MTRYAVASSPNLPQLIRSIEEALKDGWVLQGGVSTTVVPVGVVDQKLLVLYSQALTKEEKLVTQ